VDRRVVPAVGVGGGDGCRSGLTLNPAARRADIGGKVSVRSRAAISC